MPSLIRTATICLVLFAPVVFFMASGCEKSQPVVDNTDAERRAAFRKDLKHTTTSVNAGDLASARKHLDQAKTKAVTYHEQRQVKSLDLLIQGSEAYMNGDTEKAKQHWSQIPDPILQREVRAKAKSEMNLDIPVN